MMDKLSIGIAIFAALEISIILVAIWKFSGLVGKADTTNELSKTIMPISAIIAAIIIIHTVLWYFYFQYEPMAMNLYFLITGSMTMVFSLIAVSISLCQKS